MADVTAHPHSVNVLDGIEDDIRTPDKLIDGFNDTYDGLHMWLAPVLPPNVSYVKKFLISLLLFETQNCA